MYCFNKTHTAPVNQKFTILLPPPLFSTTGFRGPGRLVASRARGGRRHAPGADPKYGGRRRGPLPGCGPGLRGTISGSLPSSPIVGHTVLFIFQSIDSDEVQWYSDKFFEDTEHDFFVAKASTCETPNCISISICSQYSTLLLCFLRNIRS